MHTAHAIQMHSYGAPSVLQYGTVVVPPLQPRELRIRTCAAAVNHTDLEIRAGAWPVRSARPFPYVPGVEVVGTVAETGTALTEWSVGQYVITMMQGLGGVRAERAGGYAQFVIVNADAVAALPSTVDPFAMAALGLVGVTAYEALRGLGPLKGRRVMVTGAAGGVGSAATAIARASGASVVGVVTRPEQVDYVRGQGAQEVLVVERENPAGIPPASVDGVLDAVGGALFGPCVLALRNGGTLSLVGAVAGGDVSFDAWQLIRPVTLTGYSSETLDGTRLREAIEALARWTESGAIRVPNYLTLPLQSACDAHRLLERGGVTGRVLLVATAS